MNRVTEKQLEAVVARINRVTGSPQASYTKDESGHYTANIGNYHLSHAYGGVALYRMANEAGGVSDVLRTGHIPKRDLMNQLHAFITGFETAVSFPNQRG